VNRSQDPRAVERQELLAKLAKFTALSKEFGRPTTAGPSWQQVARATMTNSIIAPDSLPNISTATQDYGTFHPNPGLYSFQLLDKTSNPSWLTNWEPRSHSKTCLLGQRTLRAACHTRPAQYLCYFLGAPAIKASAMEVGYGVVVPGPRAAGSLGFSVTRTKLMIETCLSKSTTDSPRR
jgi:hypothetical protein